MESLSTLLQQVSFIQKDLGYINKRDEMIKTAVIHINTLRKGTAYEKIKETPANLARRINCNPFLAGKEKDGELEMILRQCKEKNNYVFLYKTLNNKR